MKLLKVHIRCQAGASFIVQHQPSYYSAAMELERLQRIQSNCDRFNAKRAHIPQHKQFHLN